MKKHNQPWLAWTGFAFAALTFLAWKRTDYIPNPSKTDQPSDTTRPSKKQHTNKDYRVGDLDKAMKDLDQAQLEMNKNMHFDMSNMEKEINQAMEQVKKINFDKISEEVTASLKNINWDKTRAEVDKAMREAEIQMKKIDISKEMEKAKENLKSAKMNINMDEIKKTVEKSMAAARVGIEKAKKEIAQLKEFTENLEKDGLIDTKKGYRIEIKKGELYINGTKQSKEISDKYRKYFKDHEDDFSISSDGEGISRI
ncbi:MAG: hypothetical protein KGO92_08575 [Bacteroidota bacterium]|nr:hypothetical protein [Bacteroidota bacterium]